MFTFDINVFNNDFLCLLQQLHEFDFLIQIFKFSNKKKMITQNNLKYQFSRLNERGTVAKTSLLCCMSPGR